MDKSELMCYIAGPMRGKLNFNFPEFYEAEEWLHENWKCGVLNPARIEEDIEGPKPNRPTEPTPQDLRRYADRDTQVIIHQATALVLLPGWESSRGASAEYALALWLGLEIYEYEEICNNE